MKLDEIPFEEIKLGTKVQGAISPGEVIKVEKDPFYKEWDQDGWKVTIKWEHSGREVPYIYYYMLGDLEIIE